MERRRAGTALAVAGVIGLIGVATACDPNDVWGNRRECAEFRMASFGQTWAPAYLDCADLY